MGLELTGDTIKLHPKVFVFAVADTAFRRHSCAKRIAPTAAAAAEAPTSTSRLPPPAPPSPGSNPRGVEEKVSGGGRGE
jgi:hypothetical protein